eukprot:g20157.t1
MALCFFLEQRPELSPPTTTLLCSAELVLTFNNFSFNSSHFLEVGGVAMGTRMGPSYACLFIGYGQLGQENFFLNRGFPSTFVDRALNRVQPISRTSILIPSLPSRNSDRIPLILIYHPTSIHIQKIISSHCCHF